MNISSVLSSLVEFFGIALGPLHEVTLYELDEHNNGTVIQTELSMMTASEIGDPMPADITRLLNQRTPSQLQKASYTTALTALYGNGQIANLSYLYLPVPQGKRYLLLLLADSTDYYNMAANLLRISNLNEKVKLGTLPPAEVNEENIIHLTSITRPQEAAEPTSVQNLAVSKIEKVIREVMGSDAEVQPAFTQEKRVEIVERLYAEDIFKIKGMVRQVARRLYCSDATVYRYLSYLDK